MHLFTKAADRNADLAELDVFVEEPKSLPGSFALHQNYPNPFNASTVIKYDLPRKANVTITVYNILGQRVATPVDAEQDAGYHEIVWDGTSIQGKPVASGVYFYRIQADGFTRSKKMLLLK